MGWRWYKDKWMNDSEYDRECEKEGQTLAHMPIIIITLLIGIFLGSVIAESYCHNLIAKGVVYISSIVIAFKLIFAEKIYWIVRKLNNLLWLLILGYAFYYIFVKN